MTKHFLVHKAIGDAFGMRFEFVEHDCDVTRADLHYGPHPKFHDYIAGSYTDDTQMCMANAELLLGCSENNMDLQPDDFIAHWLHVFQSEAQPRQGYSKHMYKVMNASRTAADFKASLDPSRGTTSGGAMRAEPFGLLPDVRDVLALTDLQARITHDTTAGRNAAKAVALTVHFLYHGGAKGAVPGFISHHLGHEWASEKSGYTSDTGNALCIVMQALTAFQKSSSLSEVLINGVTQARVTDSDTIASLAMSFASCCDEIKNDLPFSLYNDLENGPKGRGYLEALDKRLLAAYPSNHQYRGGFSPPSATLPKPGP